ncbi:MAG: hypothetical protein IKG40_01985 [Bacilli bacterium]|nr:hypothetical protein [Bacilli bacterium]
MLNLSELGIIGFLLLIVILPIIITLIVGMGIANWFGFTGIYWWAFLILFYLIVNAILTKLRV